MDLKINLNLFIFLAILAVLINSEYTLNGLQDDSLNNELNLKAKLGTSIEFICEFQNDTNYRMLWIKENSGVISINGDIKLNKNKYYTTYRRYTNDSRVEHILTIKNLDIMDQGKYICQHYDLSIVNYFNLIVLIPPSDPIITYTINNHFSQSDDYDQINLNENDDLDLKCFLKFKGNPQPIINWHKNGFFVSNQSYLNVPRVNSFDHTDVYTCIVSHEALNDSLKHNVKLNVFSKPHLNLYLKSMKYSKKKIHLLVENTSETLICSSKVNPKLTKIEWFKDGVLLTQFNQNKIELYNINKNDSGKYDCKMHNMLGIGSDSLVLNVQYKPNLEIFPIQNVVEETENYEIVCIIDSFSPNYSVKWLQIDTKNESTLLKSNNGFQIKTNSSCSSLQLNKVSKEMKHFKYKCIVSTFGHSQFDELIKFESNVITLLNVLYKPIMDALSNTIIYEPMSLTTLTCTANSNPLSIFYWYFNETLVYQNENISIQHLNLSDEIVSSTLKIIHTNIENSGFYKCLAKNKIGFDSNIFTLKSASEPSIPTDLTIINKTFSDVTISWKLMYDGGTNQTDYIVFIYDEENLCREINTTNTFLNINNLEESTFYQIKIRAENKYGTSNWSELIQLQTKEYNFTNIDMNIKINKIEQTDTNDLKLFLIFNETSFNLTYYVKLEIEYTDRKKSELIYELKENQTAVTISLQKEQNKINQYSLNVCFKTKRQLEICSDQKDIQTKLKSFISNMDNKDILKKSQNFFSRYQKSLFYISMIFLSILLIILILMGFLCCIWNYVKKKILAQKLIQKPNINTNKKIRTRKQLDLDKIITSPISAYSNDEPRIDFQYPILFTSEFYNKNEKFNKPESQHISFLAKQMTTLPELSEESSIKTTNDSINGENIKFEYSAPNLMKQDITSYSNEDNITQSSFKSSQDTPTKTKLDDEYEERANNKDESILYKVKKKVFEIVV